ncbi:MAG: efflux RND transporter periplasmic adaptor subunit [Desulfobacterales bacterium]|nr:efflux RND transporter periplasmic adaptor subunit [Pseudomonadota bacterium]MCG2773604.1 efflux RND transporter periplasmic adaptor subunit [Desulfobacterales bacterium]
MADKKKIIGLSALVVGGILFMAWLAGLLHFGKIAPGLTPLKGPPPQGRVLVVQETEIPRELEVMGAVISPTLSQVSSQVPGRVTKIWVEAGSRVKAGDPLVSLSAAEFQARLSQAQAQLHQAAADYKRYQFLLKEGAVSPQEFGAVEARYKTAQAMVAEAATLKGYTVVRAPAAGVVAERRTAVGDLAQPGQALTSLYDPDRLQIEAEVNDNYRDQVKIGEAAQVSVPAVKFEAHLAIAEIFPISAPGSRTFKVRTGRLQNPALVPGMFARLMLPLGHSRGILIPQAAVKTVGQLTMVQIAADQTAQLRQVKLGRQIGGQVEVLAGLKAGDRIMVPGK